MTCDELLKKLKNIKPTTAGLIMTDDMGFLQMLSFLSFLQAA